MNFIYAINTASQTSATADVVDITTIARRYGDISLNNNAAAISDQGWYKVNAQITFTSTAGNAAISVYQDGLAVPGAVSGLTAEASTVYTLNVQAIVKKCNCRCVQSLITIVNTGATTLTISNASVIVEKL